jgi:ribose-phosphate pyrophosphokinase
MNGDIKLFSGTANLPLATLVAQKVRFGDGAAPTKLEPVEMTRFSDGEIRVELLQNVRGCQTFIIQPTCVPTNDNLMEMILMADALRRSSAGEVIAVIPYYGYSRQDRRPGYSRVPISARIIADLIETVGISHIVTVDIHATQIQGFFHIPVDNVSATHLFVADIYSKWMGENPIIVSPDVGGVARARALAAHLDNMELAIVDKRRPKANVAEVMNIIGDVRDRTCIVIDDMVDTAGTLAKGADALIKVGGARRVVAYATHGVLSGKARYNLEQSHLHELVITDTIPLSPDMVGCGKVRQLSISGILAETIERIATGKSISEILE